MGGLFSAPKPKIVPPPPEAVAAAQTPAVAQVPSPAEVASQDRIQAQQALARGLAGTIATGPAGALLPAAVLAGAGRKSLLGE